MADTPASCEPVAIAIPGTTTITRLPISDPQPAPQIGLLGLGKMGLPIAGLLAAAGFVVTAFDPDRARGALAIARGVAMASDERAAVAGADILITVLPGPFELRETMVGSCGVLAVVRPGALWLDLTSNDPRVAAELAALASAREVSVAGAPMGGGVNNAESASLRFYVGADADAFHRVLPILSTLSEPGGIDHVGENVTAGYTAKLLANLLWFGQVAAVTEVLLLGKALGLSPATLRTTLGASAGGSVFVTEHLDRLLNGDYLEEFGIDRVVEELEALSALAEAAGTPFETSASVVRLHRDALTRFGPVGGELLGAKLLEERAGTTLRDTPE